MIKDIILRYLKGARKTAVFALTNRCNCKCIMCDMYKQSTQSISLHDAERILDFLSQNDFLMVYFTGGEPTTHPQLTEIVQYATDMGLVSTTTTNGTSSKRLISDLKDAGLYVLGVSLDHWNEEICERLRRYNGIQAKQIETINYAKDIDLKTYALTFLNPYVVNDGIDKLIKYVNSMDTTFGFCYPTKSSYNTYRLGGLISEMNSYDELDKSVHTILDMKKTGSEIATLGTYMEDILRFNRGLKPNYYCKGGEDVVYIDWHGDVYPCFLNNKMFNLFQDEPFFFKDINCNKCLINCFREPSILSQLSPSVFIKEAFYMRNVWNLFF